MGSGDESRKGPEQMDLSTAVQHKHAGNADDLHMEMRAARKCMCMTPSHPDDWSEP